MLASQIFVGVLGPKNRRKCCRNSSPRASKSCRPDEDCWFLRQHFTSASRLPLPSSYITQSSLHHCPDRHSSGWGLTSGVHSAKPSDTIAVNQTTLVGNPQMCLDKGMRIWAPQIALSCATWGSRWVFFLSSPPALSTGLGMQPPASYTPILHSAMRVSQWSDFSVTEIDRGDWLW